MSTNTIKKTKKTVKDNQPQFYINPELGGRPFGAWTEPGGYYMVKIGKNWTTFDLNKNAFVPLACNDDFKLYNSFVKTSQWVRVTPPDQMSSHKGIDKQSGTV